MTIGRSDYNAGVVPVKSVYGSGQDNVVEKAAVSVIAGATNTILTYTILAGYDFYLQSIYFFANAPGLNSFLLTLPGIDEFYLYFDTQFSINFTDAGSPYGSEGEIVKVRYKNNDVFEHTVFVLITGILIQVGS